MYSQSVVLSPTFGPRGPKVSYCRQLLAPKAPKCSTVVNFGGRGARASTVPPLDNQALRTAGAEAPIDDQPLQAARAEPSNRIPPTTSTPQPAGATLTTKPSTQQARTPQPEPHTPPPHHRGKGRTLDNQALQTAGAEDDQTLQTAGAREAPSRTPPTTSTPQGGAKAPTAPHPTPQGGRRPTHGGEGG